MDKKRINITESQLRNMITNSIKQNIIMEEEEMDTEDNSFKGKATKFLGWLEGCHQALKVMHWTADTSHKHTLTDDIDKAVLKFEDKVAEVVMGITGERITSLSSDKPSDSGLEEFLSDLEKNVLDFLDEFEGKREYRGLVNVCDDFLSDIETFKYLSELK